MKYDVPSYGGVLDFENSAAFSSIFLASSFLCSQAASMPAAQVSPLASLGGQVANRWAANLWAEEKNSRAAIITTL